MTSSLGQFFSGTRNTQKTKSTKIPSEVYLEAYQLITKIQANDKYIQQAANLLASVSKEDLKKLTLSKIELPELTYNQIILVLSKNVKSIHALLLDDRIKNEINQSWQILSLLHLAPDFISFLIKHSELINILQDETTIAQAIQYVPQYAEILLFEYNLIQHFNEKSSYPFNLIKIMISSPQIIPILFEKYPSMITNINSQLFEHSVLQPLLFYAKKGNINALYSLGVLNEHDILCRKNEKQATEFYKIAALYGHFKAQTKMATIYLEQAKQWLSHKNPTIAMQLLEKIVSSQTEFAEAQYLIGHTLYTQLSVQEEKENSLDYFKRIKEEFSHAIKHLIQAHTLGYNPAQLLCAHALNEYFQNPYTGEISSIVQENLIEKFIEEAATKEFSRII